VLVHLISSLSHNYQCHLYHTIIRHRRDAHRDLGAEIRHRDLFEHTVEIIPIRELKMAKREKKPFAATEDRAHSCNLQDQERREMGK
jgi:hypothetical protein